MVTGDSAEKKHSCPDCGFCQWCGDDRCRLCLDRTAACRRKLSLREQIALYEAVNSGGKGDGKE
ncbi:MAG TPA: hypothetical protein VI298_10320 [Geobacteraceae bacterium]